MGLGNQSEDRKCITSFIDIVISYHESTTCYEWVPVKRDLAFPMLSLDYLLPYAVWSN